MPAETVSLSIRVRSSVWLSAVAKLIYFIVGILLLAVLVRMFYTSVKLRNKVQLEKDLNDVKVRFFTNISQKVV